MVSEEFKGKVAELQECFRENATDKGLYDLIERILREDHEIKEWIDE